MKLPDKWCVRVNPDVLNTSTRESRNHPVIKYFNESQNKNKYDGTDIWYGRKNGKLTHWGQMPEGCVELTLEEFKRMTGIETNYYIIY